MNKMPSHYRQRRYRVLKRAVDFSIALPLCAVLAPAFAAVSAAIRLDSNGPALFRQTRSGEDMLPFTIVKFRTLQHAKPDPHGRYEMLETDRRITRVGRLLGATSLDELPQLFNVLGGSMSPVGPRPLVEWESREAHATHPGRFAVKPGITGLSQITVRNAEPLDRRLDVDVDYTEPPSVRSDLKILCLTPWRLVRRPSVYPNTDPR
jgi:undecaprenyl phosphate N,N'-diacetylbacillosamine 1-phosphate transferase